MSEQLEQEWKRAHCLACAIGHLQHTQIKLADLEEKAEALRVQLPKLEAAVREAREAMGSHFSRFKQPDACR